MFDDLKVVLGIGDPNTLDPGYDSVGDFLGAVINIVLGIGISISIIAIIMSGIQFITARSDPKAAQQAKDSLTYSVFAFILTLGALSAKFIIAKLFGVLSPDILNATPNF